MRIVPRSVETLIEELSRLPGVGPRTAERLAFHILKSDAAKAAALGTAVSELHLSVRGCTQCHNFAEDELCAVCQSPEREQTVLAVVEEPFDVVAIEKTGQYHGLYHVLGGVISPIDGYGPAQLEIASLIQRVTNGTITEVILATNPSLEGESTAMYIRQQLEASGVKLTRLARGLPVGGDLEYADQVTLGRALQGRQSF
ncbi:recombination protein RecR [Candidatus Saccharibacteria bacterium]|nr:recombination protein RecR [Candidatus Saccharibacteria bacterium]